MESVKPIAVSKGGIAVPSMVSSMPIQPIAPKVQRVPNMWPVEVIMIALRFRNSSIAIKSVIPHARTINLILWLRISVNQSVMSAGDPVTSTSTLWSSVTLLAVRRMFLMTDKAMEYLEKSNGWEIGVGPTVVVLDKGMASSLTTTSSKVDVYVFFFSQKGLMLGLGLQGSKISKIEPDQ